MKDMEDPVVILTSSLNLLFAAEYESRSECKESSDEEDWECKECGSDDQAYEKQGRATITRLVSKFRGYRRVKSRTPPTK